jgi:hypothetical protein
VSDEECRWEGCQEPRREHRNFCREHSREALARLFPNHPRHGEHFPLKGQASRVVLCGENNPYGSPPEYDLYPTPTGSAGHRLCHLVLGLERREYMDRYDRVNLLRSPSWSAPEARRSALGVLARWDRVVACGARVAEAFGLPRAPFVVHRVGLSLVAVIPHPSGLSREWSKPGAVERARETVAQLNRMTA